MIHLATSWFCSDDWFTLLPLHTHYHAPGAPWRTTVLTTFHSHWWRWPVFQYWPRYQWPYLLLTLPLHSYSFDATFRRVDTATIHSHFYRALPFLVWWFIDVEVLLTTTFPLTFLLHCWYQYLTISIQPTTSSTFDPTVISHYLTFDCSTYLSAIPPDHCWPVLFWADTNADHHSKIRYSIVRAAWLIDSLTTTPDLLMEEADPLFLSSILMIMSAPLLFNLTADSFWAWLPMRRIWRIVDGERRAERIHSIRFRFDTDRYHRWAFAIHIVLLAYSVTRTWYILHSFGDDRYVVRVD